jgi:hypothetical protein
MCKYLRWWQCLLTHPNMTKTVLTIFTILILAQSFGQVKPKGTFVGLEEIKGYSDPTNPKHKWYHLSVLTFKGDSVFLEKSPIALYKKDTIYSASDGGFYSYSGIIQFYQGMTIATLTLLKCDYCPLQIVRFTPPKIVADTDSIETKAADTTNGKSILSENPYIKFKNLILEKISDNEIRIDKNIYRRTRR